MVRHGIGIALRHALPIGRKLYRYAAQCPRTCVYCYALVSWRVSPWLHATPHYPSRLFSYFLIFFHFASCANWHNML